MLFRSRELPSNLRYHAYPHTEEVLNESILFAMYDGVSERDIELLAIASAFHDAGYVERYADNEEIGAALAARAMRAAGTYSDEEIHEVEQMVLSTKLFHSGPQNAERHEYTILSGYIMDADWGSFGRDDFFEKCDLLIEEVGANRETFYSLSHQLVSNQVWLTNGAYMLRNRKKLQNLRDLEARIQEMRSDKREAVARN